MDRRTFLKAASCTGLAVVSPVAFGSRNDLTARPRKSYEPYTGPLVVCVHAGGGWDPTSFCDPKGNASGMNYYPTAQIRQAGNISYAPSLVLEDGTMGMMTDAGGFPENNYHDYWFNKYAERLLVINGIDNQTNGHDAGTRATWSGKMTEGHPAFAAFAAGALSREQPMAYLASGGYNETSGLVPRTRAGDIGVLTRIAYPDRRNPEDENSLFQSERAYELIAETQRAREEAQLASMGLPRVRKAMSTLFTSRSGSNELKLLQEFLPEELSGNGLGRQAQLALAAYKAGICVSASLSSGGFDTHGNHDNGHFPSLRRLFEGVDILMDEAERMGVADRVIVVMGSDFGRTPRYNGGNGKDHWPITSVMLMGQGIRGNRVIGQTTEEHQAYGINPSDMSVDTSEGAQKIHPAHLNASLRELLGLNSSDIAAAFPLEGEPLNFFA